MRRVATASDWLPASTSPRIGRWITSSSGPVGFDGAEGAGRAGTGSKTPAPASGQPDATQCAMAASIWRAVVDLANPTQYLSPRKNAGTAVGLKPNFAAIAANNRWFSALSHTSKSRISSSGYRASNSARIGLAAAQCGHSVAPEKVQNDLVIWRGASVRGNHHRHDGDDQRDEDGERPTPHRLTPFVPCLPHTVTNRAGRTQSLRSTEAPCGRAISLIAARSITGLLSPQRPRRQGRRAWPSCGRPRS
jgi:hypothetical protein